MLGERRPACGGASNWFVRRAGLARFTTFAYALGLSLSAIVGPRPVFALVSLTVALLGSLLAAARRHLHAGTADRAGGRPSLLIVSILLTGLLAGYLLGSVRVARLLESDLQPRIGSDIQAELVVTGAVRSSRGWQSAVAVVRTVQGNSSDAAVGESVLLQLAPARGKKAAVRADEAADGKRNEGSPVLMQGAVVRVFGEVEAPRGPTESGYDQARHLLHQGIRVVLTVRPDSFEVLGTRGSVPGWFDGLRASAREHLSHSPDSRIDEVLQGVVMGDTDGIDESWLDAFRRSGTAHMLSVSGLHVACLAAIMIGLARLLRLPRWAGFLLAATAAVLMVPFVGPEPPIVRAAAMIVVVLGGRWVGRGRDQWQVLALAAVVCLIPNPFAIFDVGFQLSFAAFLGMLLLLGPLQRALRFLPPSIGGNVAVSVAASLGTAPVALAVFDKTSLVSPLANLLVVPSLPFVTGLGMASVFAGFAWSGFSVALDTLASLPMMWTILVSRLMAVAPVLEPSDLGRAVLGVTMSLAVLPISLALLGRLVQPPLGLPLPFFRRSNLWVRGHRPRNRRLAAGLAAGVVLLGLVAGVAGYPALAQVKDRLHVIAGGRAWPREIEFRVLDVGQGSAVLVRTPQRHTILFDDGPAGCDLAEQLRDLGVDELDVVVISHPHADHFAGLLEALDDIEVRNLVDNVQVVASHENGARGPTRAGVARAAGQGGAAGTEASEYLELRRRLASRGCAYMQAKTGDSVAVDGVRVAFFAPRRSLTLVASEAPWEAEGGEPSGDELNASSLVAVASAGPIDMVLPGDAEAEVLARHGLPPAELLVVAHHGSRGAVTPQLLAEWGIQTALISVGRDNQFGHPDPATLSILEQTVGLVVRTDKAGWVSCSVHEGEMTISAEHLPTDDERK